MNLFDLALTLRDVPLQRQNGSLKSFGCGESEHDDRSEIGVKLAGLNVSNSPTNHVKKGGIC